MANSFELPDEAERLLIDLEDDVRSFLLRRLPWSRMHSAQRARLQELGVDTKKLRRPSYIAVSHTDDDDESSPETRASRCSVGAEGVMTQHDEKVIHLAFKCGDERHPYHYSTFGLDTVIAMARAAEATWPKSVSRAILQEMLRQRGKEIGDILNPGDDEIDFNEPDEDELEEIDLDEDDDDDEEDDIVI